MFKSINREKTVKQRGWAVFRFGSDLVYKTGVHKASMVPCYYGSRVISTMMKVNFVCASKALA